MPLRPHLGNSPPVTHRSASPSKQTRHILSSTWTLPHIQNTLNQPPLPTCQRSQHPGPVSRAGAICPAALVLTCAPPPMYAHTPPPCSPLLCSRELWGLAAAPREGGGLWLMDGGGSPARRDFRPCITPLKGTMPLKGTTQ